MGFFSGQLTPLWLLLGEGEPLEERRESSASGPPGDPLTLARDLVKGLTGRECQVAVEALDAREGRLELRFWPRGERPYTEATEPPESFQVQEQAAPFKPERKLVRKRDGDSR